MCKPSPVTRSVPETVQQLANYLQISPRSLQLALHQTDRDTRLSSAVCAELLLQILTPSEHRWQQRVQLALLELEWSALQEPEAELISLQQALYQCLSHSGALQS